MSKDLVFYQELLIDIKKQNQAFTVNLSILPMPLAKLESIIRKRLVSQLTKESILPLVVAKLENDTFSTTSLAKLVVSAILQLAVAKLRYINFFSMEYKNKEITKFMVKAYASILKTLI